MIAPLCDFCRRPLACAPEPGGSLMCEGCAAAKAAAPGKRWTVLFGLPEKVGESLDNLEQDLLDLKVEGSSTAADSRGQVWLTVVVSFREPTG